MNRCMPWVCLALLMSAVVAGPAVAQKYPDQNVRLIVPFPAGGGVDVVARVLATKLTEQFNRPVLVENRPGAGGNVGAAVVASAPPDGHTILITVGAIASSVSLYKKLNYDPIRDLAPVMQLADTQLPLAGSYKYPAATIQDVIAEAKAHPGVLNYGSSGVGAPLHILAETFKHAAGIEIAHIPYRGDAPMLSALISGDVQLGFMPLSTGVPQIKEKIIRGLAITGRKRLASLPELPTFLELGLTGLETGSWYGVFVRAGTPPDVIDTIQRAVTAALALPDVRDRMLAVGLEPISTTPAEFDAFFKSEIARFAKLVEAAKIPKLD
ncbi:Bug family tripartite tricarboxylate transporter substrate binding protein [Rhodoplanes sp. Z2-YC6860]|uniref:Bug family tripartite tricarboxylate transporter substrate binding protein n=1 Tax=Rhodoplanes sp. Z2-YC6860 TaxID=674703 RepID=UPI00078BCABF|nr:tripartite tricarboxylate transporter substrate binding protein [Rhodoplanes sp. Z2-YC6860]AMN39283.1 extra-cytoplasmic solute receptor [Rhodoplanes sp. Z2-YC6860]